MRRLWTLLAVVVLPATMATAVAPGPARAGGIPRTYHGVDLGDLGGGWTIPMALNNRDEVVGYSAVAGTSHPFFWRAGKLIDLGVLPGSSSTGSANSSGVAYDINDRGQVVGTTDAGAFLWYRGAMTPLRASGSVLSSAHGINNRGQIVGTYVNPHGEAHGYLWQRGRITDLGAIAPVDVNDRGEILADRWVEGTGYRACLWRHGRVTDLGIRMAVAINNQGWIVGLNSTAYATRAVLWRSGTLTELPTLGGRSNWAQAINDRGQVLGTSRSATDETHAFIWEQGRAIDLSTRGVLLETIPRQKRPGDVAGINNHGHLVANLGQPSHWPGPGVLFR